MAQSGIKAHPDCEKMFGELKIGKAHRYIVYKLNDKMTEIEVDKIGARDETYDEFKAYILEKPTECRHAVFDLDFTLNDAKKNKIVFVAWAPDNSSIKQKMVYTSCKDTLKKKLQVIVEAQCTDTDELSIENIEDRAKRGMKE